MFDTYFPPKLQFLFRPSRYKVAHGGRGGAKSWGFARALLIMAGKIPLRILCAREYQNSIRDSVHKLLSDQIERWGLDGCYDVQQNVIKSAAGSEFVFAGLRQNIRNIKSFEGVDIAWVEEAEKVSSDSWEKLIPTIRKAGSEIWVSFNPDEETDPTYQRFIKNTPENAVVQKIGWEDNPWLPEELRAEKDYLYKVDPDGAAHVWGGECRTSSAAQVLHGKWAIEDFEPDSRYWDGPYFGADWGFASDPAALVKLWIYQRKLYVEHEVWGLGIEIDEIPKRFQEVEGADNHVIRADSARPETISYVAKHGLPKTTKAPKWDGSVKDGISHLRSYEKIIIHPRCKHAVEEAKLWKYKTDKLTGDVLPDLVKGNDHIWDAARYALSPLIKTGRFAGCDLS